MVLWNGNSNAMGQGSSQFTGSSPEIVPIDTTIKSKIPRPAPPEAPVTPPNINMPGAGLPKLDMPAPSRPTSLVQSLSKAIDPNDPKYKMGIGGRIMGTVANFLSGMARQGPAVYTGKGAVNSRYYRDEGNRLRQLNDARARDELSPRPQQDSWQQQNWGKPQQQAPANGSSSGNDEDEKPLFGFRTDR
jgi:hypothetical protein